MTKQETKIPKWKRIQKMVDDAVKEVEDITAMIENYQPDVLDYEDEFNCYLDNNFDGYKLFDYYYEPSQIIWKCDRDEYNKQLLEFANKQFELHPNENESFILLQNDLLRAQEELEELESDWLSCQEFIEQTGDPNGIYS